MHIKKINKSIKDIKDKIKGQTMETSSDQHLQRVQDETTQGKNQIKDDYQTKTQDQLKIFVQGKN